MRVAKLSHRNGSWSGPLPTHLDSPSTLVLAFGASHLLDDAGPLRTLRAAMADSHILGCSTSGQIHDRAIVDDELTVTAVRFEHTRLQAAQALVADKCDSRDVARGLAQQLAAPDLRGVLVVSDGLGVNGSELARGFRDVFGAAVPVTGGLAGDGDRFARTWTTTDGTPRQAQVAAVGFYGDRVEFRHGSKGGWDVFGPERRITRAADNVLYELDRQPALSLYRTYLGDRAAGLPATALLFPLALRIGDEPREQLVRTILAVDDTAQSLTFAGDVPEGSLVQLMWANFDRLVDGAGTAARAAAGPTPRPGLAIAISCVGRRLVLGERAEEEIEAAAETLPADTHLTGFYSYGELAPSASGTCDLHNQTMTLTHIVED